MGDGEMPAETIYDATGNVDIRVSWGDESMETVQIVSQAAHRTGVEDPTARLIGIVNEWLEAAGEPTIDLAKLKEAMPFQPSFDGWWATLNDWGSVNRLIKVLQRARDRSFGTPG